MSEMRKQALFEDALGGATSKATPGTVLNTFLNPAAYMLPGNYWIPKTLLGGKDSINNTVSAPFPTKSPAVNAMMFHTVAIGTTAAAVGALAVALHRMTYGEKEERKRRDMLEARLQTETPVFSAGPESTREQHNIDQAGMDKQAGDKVNSLLTPSLSVILPIAALAAGGIVGYRGAGVAMDKAHEKTLDTDLDEAKKEMEREQYESLLRARGATPEQAKMEAQAALEKRADLLNDAKARYDQLVNWLGRQATTLDIKAKQYTKDTRLPESTSNGAGAVQRVSALAGLLLASTYVTSTLASKSVFDSVDPYRREASDMKNAVQELSRSRYKDQPIEIRLSNPATVKRLDERASEKNRPQSGITPYEPVSA